MKSKTLQEYYLDLLGAWGDSPLDEEGVMEILEKLQRQAYRDGYGKGRIEAEEVEEKIQHLRDYLNSLEEVEEEEPFAIPGFEEAIESLDKITIRK